MRAFWFKIIAFILFSLVAIRLGFYIFKSGYMAAWPLFILVIALVLYLITLILPVQVGTGDIKFQIKKGLKKSRVRMLYSKKFPQLLCNLYVDHIQHYPENIQEIPERMPKLVTGAIRDGDKIRIVYNLKEYGFRFDEWGDDAKDGSFAKLEIFSNNKKVAVLLLKQRVSQRYQRSWQATSMDVLSLGSWAKSLDKLAKIAARIKIRQARGHIHWQD